MNEKPGTSYEEKTNSSTERESSSHLQRENIELQVTIKKDKNQNESDDEDDSFSSIDLKDEEIHGEKKNLDKIKRAEEEEELGYEDGDEEEEELEIEERQVDLEALAHEIPEPSLVVMEYAPERENESGRTRTRFISDSEYIRNLGRVQPDVEESFCAAVYHLFHYNIFPPLFLCSTPLFVLLLAFLGHNKQFILEDAFASLVGNCQSWITVAAITIWATGWLIIPGNETLGPFTYYKERAKYKDNGFQYYLTTVTVFLIMQYIFSDFSSTIFWNMPYLIGSLNLSAFALCLFLFAKGISTPEHPDEIVNLPTPYVFYRGVELNPTFHSIQVKQLTNCRIGLMLWQLLIIAFYITGCQRNGFNWGSFVNFTLQTIYLAKFYWWESGYFWTLDMTHDDAGYYICWGCLVLVPALYTYSSYYLVLHPSTMSEDNSIVCLLLGTFSILMNYRVDYEKRTFQKTRFSNNDFKLWCKSVEYVTAYHRDAEGNLHVGKLLTTGCWGVARHLNYLFELLSALFWSLPGYGLGIHTFAYLIFLTYLLIHRCYRDEKKCRGKYGESYAEYCKQVPYRIIPYVF